MVGNLISMVLGFAAVTKEKADELSNLLIEKGEMQREETRIFTEQLIEKGETERNAYLLKLMENIELLRNKIVTKQDIEKLEEQIENLNKKIQDN